GAAGLNRFRLKETAAGCPLSSGVLGRGDGCMNRANTTHPGAEQLAAFGLGRLPPHIQAEVERHVADCDVCCAALRQVADDTLVGQLRQMSTSPEGTLPSAPPRAPGTTVPPELAD